MYSLKVRSPLRTYVSNVIAFTFARCRKHPVENLHLYISTNANSRVAFSQRQSSLKGRTERIICSLLSHFKWIRVLKIIVRNAHFTFKYLVFIMIYLLVLIQNHSISKSQKDYYTSSSHRTGYLQGRGGILQSGSTQLPFLQVINHHMLRVRMFVFIIIVWVRSYGFFTLFCK